MAFSSFRQICLNNAGELNAGEIVFSFFGLRAFWICFYFSVIRSRSKVMRAQRLDFLSKFDGQNISWMGVSLITRLKII